MTSPGAGIEELLREFAPQILGVLARRHGQFSACEDAVQEALLAAAIQWPTDGVPENPRAWLMSVASRRLIDEWRSDSARRRREDSLAALTPTDLSFAPTVEVDEPVEDDDTLTLVLMCCHPSLPASAQLALTLRAVGGLTTAEIARACFVPEATMAQRISRAKARIKAAGIPFAMPPASERSDRLRVVLHVLYLIFNEGYTASAGPTLSRAELTGEAIRLTRIVHRLLPQDGEVCGLLALMLLSDARRPARTRADGSLVSLDEQDRSLWNAAYVHEGIELIMATLGRGAVGPYQLQAAIAAVHDEAPSAAETDWPQIVALYGVLEHVAPSPAVTLNRAVALAMVDGPQAGLALLATLDADDRIRGQHRLPAVRGHLLERAGEIAAAREAYQRAASLTTSLPERHYLTLKAAALNRPG